MGGMVLQGIFLFVFGPGLASWISPNLMEQASIWCFFSIAQISIMLFLIRETLVIHWGKNISVFDSKKKEAKAAESCRDFVNCEYCKLTRRVWPSSLMERMELTRIKHVYSMFLFEAFSLLYQL